LQVFEKYDHCIAMDVNKKISDPISDLEEYFTKDQGDEIEIEYTKGDENTEPFIGMEFTSLFEAEQFYNSYASRLGFSVRRNTSYKSKVGLSFVRLVCSKQGLSKQKKQDEMEIRSDLNAESPTKEVPIKRDSCGAYIRFRRLHEGKWTISAFIAEHNHVLIVSPAKKRNLRSLRGMTNEERVIVREMRAQNVSTSQIWHYLAERAGGSSNLKFKKKDVSNRITEENKMFDGVDVETTMIYFEQKRKEDPDFFLS
jgi:FAR1 DNA-binding domain